MDNKEGLPGAERVPDQGHSSNSQRVSSPSNQCLGNTENRMHPRGPPPPPPSVFGFRTGWMPPNRERFDFGSFGHSGSHNNMPPMRRSFFRGPQEGGPEFIREKFPDCRSIQPGGPSWQTGSSNLLQIDKRPGPNRMPVPPLNRKSAEELWVEAKTGDGKSYFYSVDTRATSWVEPKGPNICIMFCQDQVGYNGGSPGNPNQDICKSSDPPDANNSECRLTKLKMYQPSRGTSPYCSPNSPIIRSPGYQGHNQNQSNGAPNMSHGDFQKHPGFNYRLSPGQIPRPGQISASGSPVRFPCPTGVPEVQMSIQKRNSPINNASPVRQPGKFSVRPPGPGSHSGDNYGNLNPNVRKLEPGSPLPQPNQHHRFPPTYSNLAGDPSFGRPSIPAFHPSSLMFPPPPPPWNLGNGPIGVPPPSINTTDVSQIDPKLLSKAYEWSEHVAPNGLHYFFNKITFASVWEKPQCLIDFEAAKGIMLQRNDVPQMSDSKQQLGTGENKPKEKKDFSTSLKEKRKSGGSGNKSKAISSTPVQGSPWCVVWTTDRRVFFYKAATKESVWERPAALIGRSDVDDLVKAPQKPKSPSKTVKKAEATSTTSSASETQKSSPDQAKTSTSIFEAHDSENNSDSEPPAKKFKKVSKSKEIKVIIKSKNTVIKMSERKETAVEAVKQEANDFKDTVVSPKSLIEEEQLRIETKDAIKDANALEVEVKAARERARIPIETRLKQYREMLVEKQVSAFSTWEQELHKIVFDPRYLLLASKERKSAFDSYIKERAEEERREKALVTKLTKQKFMEFLNEVGVDARMTFNEFHQRHGRKEICTMVEKLRDREAYFTEYVSSLIRKAKEERAAKRMKATEDFLKVLKKEVTDYHMKWYDIKKIFDGDSKYDVMDPDQQKELFKTHQRQLKTEIKAEQKKKKREAKETQRQEIKKMKLEMAKQEEVISCEESAISKPVKLENIKNMKSLMDPERTEKVSNENIETVDKKAENATEKLVKTKEEGKSTDKEEPDRNLDKLEEVSEEEDGCITYDSDEEFRLEREQRQMTSMREREKKVKETLAENLKGLDREREFHRHETAVHEFQALLADYVKNAETSWESSKKSMKKDHRWNAVSKLDREEMKDLFFRHLGKIFRNLKQRFRDLLHEHRVNPMSNWSDVKKKIKSDPRYLKFSSSERECENEFERYLKDMSSAAVNDFIELLRETRMLTFRTRQKIRENSLILKNIEYLLSKDKRYLQLDTMSGRRSRLLLEYLDDLEHRGPPPPPTASYPRRWRHGRD